MAKEHNLFDLDSYKSVDAPSGPEYCMLFILLNIA
jgi:hypothetical protein